MSNSVLERTAIRAAVERALGETTSLSDVVIQDVAFHLTDWLSELEAWHEVCVSPGAPSAEQISDVVEQLLIHAPHHLAAACKLLTGDPVTDVFGVGAVALDFDEDERSK